MLVPAAKYAPSSKLTAINFSELDFRERPARNSNDVPYLSISAPSITTRRKEGKDLLYYGSVGFFGRRNLFPYAEGEFDVDQFAEHLDRGSAHLSLNAKGKFLTITETHVDYVLEGLQVLKAAFASYEHLPPGFSGWYKQV